MARKTGRSITPILLIKSHTKQGYETLLYNNTNNLIHQIIEVPSPLDFTKLSIDSRLMPTVFALQQNYPNPFNPVTKLRYAIPKNGLVTITIYDMLSRQVKTLINQTQNAGYKSVIWDATNDYGKPVSAGIYLYQIQAGEYISTKKMVLLK